MDAFKKADAEPTGRVLEIQRMSTEDGPGIRTTVFLKGCSLSCAWCHNPESISAAPQLQWIGSRCIGCLGCLEACHRGALSAGEAGIDIDRQLCRACGECAEQCPSTALELLGRQWSASELAREVAKDRAYFQSSDGGVTISGGEAALQAPFAAAFLGHCRTMGLHTALDTCGQAAPEALELILPLADMVLYDLKLMDPARHRLHTGASNERILANLALVGRRLEGPGNPARLWVRTPIIPGATDDEANIRAISRFLGREMPGLVERWELCAFNNLCRDKYLRLGRVWAYHQTPLMTAPAMEALAQVAKVGGVNPDIVVWSGATRLEEDAGDHRRLAVIDGGRGAAVGGECP